MALRADVAKLVGVAFDLVGDLKEVVDIQYLRSLGAYDPVADAESSVWDSTLNLKVVFTHFALNELDGSVDVKTDMKILLEAAKVNFVAPKETDVLRETVSGNTWNVMGYKSVPGNSLFIVHVRRM